MTLSMIGWINGLSAMGVLISYCAMGLFFIYKSKKTGAKMLVLLGTANLFAGLTFLGVFLDFFLVIFRKDKVNAKTKGTIIINTPVNKGLTIIIGMNTIINIRREEINSVNIVTDPPNFAPSELILLTILPVGYLSKNDKSCSRTLRLVCLRKL